MEGLNAGDQLFVNDKWYMDVKSVTESDIRVRIRYKEGANGMTIYKVIKLPKSLFSQCQEQGFVKTCSISERDLKRQIGGLIDRLIVETDISKIFEDGAVSNPGLSGTPGLPGSAGSGDVAGFMPKGEFGLEIIPNSNRKQIGSIKKIAKKARASKPLLRNALLNVIGEDYSQGDAVMSDNDYKKTLFEFLDYPAENEHDIAVIKAISDWRKEFVEISGERIKQYFRDFYKMNRALIDECSDWLQNYMEILSDSGD